MSESRNSLSSRNNKSTVVRSENLRKAPKINCEECKSHEEYINVLKNALKEVLDQNEALRARVAELEALISQSEDELDEKNQLIAQLKQTLQDLETQRERQQSLIQEIEKSEKN